MSNVVTGLKVDDEAFLVTSLIERCPRVMMLRELVQNGIEAAMSAPLGQRMVRIFGLSAGGVSKLAIWNTGPGMDAQELYRMCDIAASIRKTKGLSQNFGMGAKVAGLASNAFGMRYRSCRGGRVHEVLVGQRNGVYGRLRTAGRDGRISDIHDVTQSAREEGAALDFDWTEVVLLGNRLDQDTIVDPYDGDPAVGRNWIANTLYRRYFSLPEGVEITLQEGLHAFDGERVFSPLSRRVSVDGARHEAVEIGEGVRAHYFYDPKHPKRFWETLSSNAEMQQEFGLLALAHRGEMYRTRTGSPWAHGAAAFGIAFAARHYSIVVELPDEYPVIPDTYRMFLQKSVGDPTELQIDFFAEAVRELRPQWLRDQQSDFAHDAAATDDLYADIVELSRKLGVPAVADPATESQRGMPYRLMTLTDEQDIRDRWLWGRAAAFEPNTAELFVNMGYPAAQRLATQAMSEAAIESRTDAAQDLALELAQKAMLGRICRAAVYALSKKLQPETWNEGNVTRGLSPESFSAAAEDLDAFLPSIRNALEKAGS